MPEILIEEETKVKPTPNPKLKDPFYKTDYERKRLKEAKQEWRNEQKKQNPLFKKRQRVSAFKKK